MPNGTGVYYYHESGYYDGNFQDAIKEGNELSVASKTY